MRAWGAVWGNGGRDGRVQPPRTTPTESIPIPPKNPTFETRHIRIHTVHETRTNSRYVRDAAESQVSAVELFLNSVPILSPLSRDEKLRLVDAFETRTFTPGAEVSRRWPLCVCVCVYVRVAFVCCDACRVLCCLECCAAAAT